MSDPKSEALLTAIEVSAMLRLIVHPAVALFARSPGGGATSSGFGRRRVLVTIQYERELHRKHFHDHILRYTLLKEYLTSLLTCEIRHL